MAHTAGKKILLDQDQVQALDQVQWGASRGAFPYKGGPVGGAFPFKGGDDFYSNVFPPSAPSIGNPVPPACENSPYQTVCLRHYKTHPKCWCHL